MRHPRYKYVLFTFDVILFFASILATSIICSIIKSTTIHLLTVEPVHTLFIVLFLCIQLLTLYVANLYKLNILLDPLEHVFRIVASSFIVTILLGFFAFIFRSYFMTESRLFVFVFFPVTVSMYILWRVFLFVSLYKYLAKHKFYSEHTLIVGSGNAAKLLAANIEFNPSLGLTLIGFVDDTLQVDTVLYHSKKVLGTINDIDKLVEQYEIDEIIISNEQISIDRLLEIFDLCLKTTARVKIATPLYDIVMRKFHREFYGTIPVLELSKNVSSYQYFFLKRCIDIIFTVIGLLFLAPLFLLIAIAIYIDSGRPIIFSQIRIGKDGKPFKFYKFRSMYPSKDEYERKNKMRDFIKRGRIDGKTQKIVDVKRITRVGKFIRKTSLDELPQLFNVLKGDMSLVGPRPCLPYEWEEYDEWQKRRLSAKPGCTGVWQVSGRSEVSFNDMVIMDIYYNQQQSLLLDLKIILKTIPVMVMGKGGI